MSFSIYAKTRSARLTVTLPDGGPPVVIENMSGDDGFSMQFKSRRTMDDSLGSLTVDLWNLPPDVLGLIESSQVRKVDDLDAALSGCVLYDAGVDPVASEAGSEGFAIVELEAGYDGQLTRVFQAIGARIESERDEDDLSNKTSITCVENLDGLLFGLPLRSFPAGSTTFEVLDYLRSCIGLGPGNLTYESWSALVGDSKLSAPFHVSAGDALELLKVFMVNGPARWFLDDRQIWVCGRDGVANAGKVPPFIVGTPHELPPILRRPRRREGGLLEVVCLLAPAPAPGQLVLLQRGGLAIPGVVTTPQQIARAQVPAGVYRVETVDHSGDTSSDGEDAWTSTFLLRSMPAM